MRGLLTCLFALAAAIFLLGGIAIAQSEDCNDYILETDYCSDFQTGCTGSILFINGVNCTGCGTEAETQATLTCSGSTCIPPQKPPACLQCQNYPGYLVPTHNPNCSSGGGGGGGGCDAVGLDPDCCGDDGCPTDGPNNGARMAALLEPWMPAEWLDTSDAQLVQRRSTSSLEQVEQRIEGMKAQMRAARSEKLTRRLLDDVEKDRPKELADIKAGSPRTGTRSNLK